MVRNRKGRPRKERKAHHVTLSLDEESWEIYNRRRLVQNMSEEYQLMLKARYGDTVSLQIKLASWKEKMPQLHKERDNERRKLEDKYELKFAQVVKVIKEIAMKISEDENNKAKGMA